MGSSDKKKRKHEDAADEVDVVEDTPSKDKKDKKDKDKGKDKDKTQKKKPKLDAEVQGDQKSNDADKDKPIYVSPISSPMADPKLSKRLLKLVSKAAKAKQLRRGIKEVSKAIRKGNLGICVIAGDIYPIDVISHMPVTLEEARVPYCYVPRKDELGAASMTKRPTSIVLVAHKKGSELEEDYTSCAKSIKDLPVTYKVS
mmetsp:Transcript_15817/g.27753  ORF Transcript_15817/g.27753 Transcript_15817/m.27753 type:complete len:200 (-) Transcript_15817:64-663(-)